MVLPDNCIQPECPPSNPPATENVPVNQNPNQPVNDGDDGRDDGGGSDDGSGGGGDDNDGGTPPPADPCDNPHDSNDECTEKILSPDGIEQGQFGRSSAIDGSIAAIGCQISQSNNNQGSVYIYSFNGTCWVKKQELMAEDGTSGLTFGSNIKLKHPYLLVGDNSNNKVYVFKNAGTITDPNFLQVATLIPSSSSGTFGQALAVDNGIAIVGSTGDGIYVYYESNDWSQNYKITISGLNNLLFDTIDVQASRTGLTFKLAVGNFANNEVLIYDLSSTSATLVRTISNSAGSFGISVSISSDHLIVGSTDQIHIYKLSGINTWTLVNSFSNPDPNLLNFGRRLVNLDNFVVTSAIAGASSSVQSGKVYLYHKSATSIWFLAGYVTVSSKVTGTFVNFGISLDITSFNGGHRIIAGSSNDAEQGSRTGSTFILKLQECFNLRCGDNNIVDILEGNTSAIIEANITSPAVPDEVLDSNTMAGSSDPSGGLDASQNWIIATNASIRKRLSWIYEKTNDDTLFKLREIFYHDIGNSVANYSVYNSSNQIIPLNLSTFSHGGEVSIHNDTLVIGIAYGYADNVTKEFASDGTLLNGPGFVEAYKYNGTKWITDKVEIKASDANNRDQFGWSVAVSDNYLVVGAPKSENPNKPGDFSFTGGKIYVFKRTSAGTNAWTEEDIIEVPEPSSISSNNFGYTVGVVEFPDGNVVALASDHHTSRLANKKIYAFLRQSDGSWTQSGSITLSNFGETDGTPSLILDVFYNRICIKRRRTDRIEGCYIFDIDNQGVFSHIQTIDTPIFDPAKSTRTQIFSASLNNDFLILGDFTQKHGDTSGLFYVYRKQNTYVLSSIVTSQQFGGKIVTKTGRTLSSLGNYIFAGGSLPFNVGAISVYELNRCEVTVLPPPPPPPTSRTCEDEGGPNCVFEISNICQEDQTDPIAFSCPDTFEGRPNCGCSLVFDNQGRRTSGSGCCYSAFFEEYIEAFPCNPNFPSGVVVVSRVIKYYVKKSLLVPNKLNYFTVHFDILHDTDVLYANSTTSGVPRPTETRTGSSIRIIEEIKTFIDACDNTIFYSQAFPCGTPPAPDPAALLIPTRYWVKTSLLPSDGSIVYFNPSTLGEVNGCHWFFARKGNPLRKDDIISTYNCGTVDNAFCKYIDSLGVTGGKINCDNCNDLYYDIDISVSNRIGYCSIVADPAKYFNFYLKKTSSLLSAYNPDVDYLTFVGRIRSRVSIPSFKTMGIKIFKLNELRLVTLPSGFFDLTDETFPNGNIITHREISFIGPTDTSASTCEVVHQSLNFPVSRATQISNVAETIRRQSFVCDSACGTDPAEASGGSGGSTPTAQVTSWRSAGAWANTLTSPFDSGNKIWAPVPVSPAGDIDASDDTYVSSGGSGLGDERSQGLLITSFGFTATDIPSGATIDGVEARFEIKDDGNPGQVQWEFARLVLQGAIGSYTGNDGGGLWPASDTIQTKGSSTDKWGVTPTRADALASNTGVAISINPSVAAVAWGGSVDHVQMRWHFTA